MGNYWAVGVFLTKEVNTTYTPVSVAKILGIYNGVSYLAIVYIVSILVSSWEALLSAKGCLLQPKEP